MKVGLQKAKCFDFINRKREMHTAMQPERMKSFLGLRLETNWLKCRGFGRLACEMGWK